LFESNVFARLVGTPRGRVRASGPTSPFDRRLLSKRTGISRARADTEIGKWAEGTSRFRKLRMEIVAQFPRAQKSLADYYKDRFEKSDEKADEMAQQASDIASDIVFRSYFVGPSG
jgi:hypothetical protein